MKNENIWRKALSKDEKVEYEFSVGDRYVKFYLIIFGILSVLFLIMAPGLGIFTFIVSFFYYGFYLKKANIFAFTNKRVLIHRGWLSTHLVSVDYSKITDVHVTEGILERIITHTGALGIISAGSTSDQIVVKNVSEPYELKKRLDSLKDGN